MSNILISGELPSCASTGDVRGEFRFNAYTRNNPPETSPGEAGDVTLNVDCYYASGGYKVGAQYVGPNASSDFVLNGFIDGDYKIVVTDHTGDFIEFNFSINCTGGGTIPPVPDPLELESKKEFGPEPPATTGKVQIDTKGGLAPLRISIPGITGTPPTLDSAGYIEVTGIPPGSYLATVSDSSTPALTLEAPFTIPVYVAPEPELPAALEEPRGLNSQTFPFAAEGELLWDAQGLGCADAPYLLVMPTDRFLPFCLRRLTSTKRLDCARVVHAFSGEELLRFPIEKLAYEKYADAVYDYFLYYGAIVDDLALPCGVPLRLVLDEFTSVAFTAVPDLSSYLLTKWFHGGPLGGIPYGTGLQQWLYVYNATLRDQPTREEKTETVNAATGERRLDFLAQFRVVSFDIEPVPSYLVQALQAAKAHSRFLVDGLPPGEAKLTEVKQTALSADSCLNYLTLTVEDKRVLISKACAVAPPLLVPVPEGYTPGPC